VVGLVRRRVFLGNVVRLIVAVDGGLIMTAELVQSSGETLDEGVRVGLGWNGRDGTVLPRRDGATAR
jgi:hypothetical protein